MKVIVSDHSKEMVYHRTGCPHAARIKTKYRMNFSSNQARVMGYRRCKCCGNLRGTIRALTVSPEKLGAGRNLSVTYDRKSDTAYIRTEIGFWKVFWKEGFGLLLYHLNRFDNSKTTEALSRDAFHRQKDVLPTESLDEILTYIEAHDRAMQIIADDYRKLPQRTKKQRKYFRQAESRHRRRQINRVFALFSDLEQGKNTANFVCD